MNKLAYATQKEDLQTQFFEVLGLRTYVPVAGGNGNSNTGPTVKKAFDNCEEFSQITGFPLDLLDDLDALLRALRCTDERMDPDLYEYHAQDWLNRFHSNPNANWCWLSQTVHTVVEHGAQVMRALPCSVGLSNEEAAEHNSKLSCQITNW